MGAEIYQNLKSVVKKKYGIDGIFFKLILLLFSSIPFPEKRDSNTYVWGTLWLIICDGCQHKKEFLSFKSKFTYPLNFVTTPVQKEQPEITSIYLCWPWCNSLSLWSQCFFFHFFQLPMLVTREVLPLTSRTTGKVRGYNILHSLRYPRLETILLFDIFMSTSPWISNTDHYYFKD